jgi:hypothetical protein
MTNDRPFEIFSSLWSVRSRVREGYYLPRVRRLALEPNS